MNEDYNNILIAAGYDNAEVKTRRRALCYVNKRIVIACILSDMRYEPREIAEIIDRDRSTIYHYLYKVRHLCDDDIRLIKDKMNIK